MIDKIVLFILGILLLGWLLGCAEAQAHDGAFTPPRNAIKYRRQVIREAQYRFGLKADAALFMGQIHQESGFREDAKSKFAFGIAQFVPATAEWIQSLYPADLECETRKGCPLDAGWAIRAMVLYDKRLWDSFPLAQGDERNALMLVSYNSGIGWVRKERKLAESKGADPEVWFGSVENYCIRAAWACSESKGYPRRILLVWRHHYRPLVGQFS